jgi:hypothetical protein
VRYQANCALEDIDALLAGANARKRSGTWHPAAARNADDYAALGRAEDITGVEHAAPGRVLSVRW